MKRCRTLTFALALAIVPVFHGSVAQSPADADGALQAGAIARADSLYAMLDGIKRLDAFGYMQWAQVKAVLGRTEEAASLLCQACRNEPRLCIFAQNQLLRVIDEAEESDPAAAFAAFRTCMAATPMADTAGFRSWLADAFARKGLYRQAMEVLTEKGADSARGSQQLLSMARTFLVQRHYPEARTAAKLAFVRHPLAQGRSASAAILYQTYAAQGTLDSAVVWLRKADLGVIAHKCDAVVIYQRAGLLRPADSLIATLPEGVMRDTLTLRQKFFARAPGEALGAAEALVSRPAWIGASADASLWRIRALLFSGGSAAASGILDTLTVPPAWSHAAEVLGYRYTARLLGPSPSDPAAWSAVAFALYLDEPERVDPGSVLTTCSPRLGAVLTSGLVGALIRGRNYAAAASLLGTAPGTGMSAELRYLRGEVLLMQGEVPRGRSELETLIMERPQDVFSSRARLLLSRIGGKP